ncbi:MAG: hypothetical protein AB8B59_12635 [Maribacter sp.]
MKILKIIVVLTFIISASQITAQEVAPDKVHSQSGFMNAEVTHTLAYMKDGVERPYKVTIRESRSSITKFDKADIGKIDQDLISTPRNVAILLTITNPFDNADNRVIAMRYDKYVNDNFKLESTNSGFTVHVDEKILEYTIGKGISYPNPSDENYFKANEFDVVK